MAAAHVSSPTIIKKGGRALTRRKLITLGLAVLCLLVAAAFCIGFFRLDYAFGAQQKLAGLTVNAELLENGNLRITEHWQVQYAKRDAPYGNHSLFISKTNAEGVQDFTVYDADYGREYRLAEGGGAFTTPEWSCYTQESPIWYELGWNFPELQSGERNYTVSYTLTGVAANYADADELRYPFLSGSNTLPVKRFQLTLHFPNGGRKQDVNAWVHCAEGSTWNLADSGILTVTADNLPARTELELRLLLPSGSIQSGSGLFAGTPIVQAALAEEAGNGQGRGAMGQYRHFSVLLSILGGAAALAVVVFLLVRSERKLKAALSAEVPLRRELPTCVRPAIMARLYYHENASDKGDGGEGYALSATTLSLLHKRWLAFQHCGQGGGLRIAVQEQGQSPAEGEELVLLEIYKALAAEQGGSFTLEDLENHKKAHPARAEKALAAFNEAVRRRFSRLGWARPVRFFTCPLGWAALSCLVLALLCLLLGQFAGKGILAGGLLLAALPAGLYAAFRLRLTQKGLKELKAWRGFAKYLREYSLLCEDPYAELSLWGDYMVYASAFGFSKTLAAELALVQTRLAEQPPPFPGCEWPPPSPLPRFFGTAEEGEATGQNGPWSFSFGVSKIARAFRVWRSPAGRNPGSPAARFHRALSQLRRRFGLR